MNHVTFFKKRTYAERCQSALRQQDGHLRRDVALCAGWFVEPIRRFVGSNSVCFTSRVELDLARLNMHVLGNSSHPRRLTKQIYCVGYGQIVIPVCSTCRTNHFFLLSNPVWPFPPHSWWWAQSHQARGGLVYFWLELRSQPPRQRREPRFWLVRQLATVRGSNARSDWSRARTKWVMTHRAFFLQQPRK